MSLTSAPKSLGDNWVVIVSDDDASNSLPAPKAPPNPSGVRPAEAAQSANPSKGTNDFFFLSDDFDSSVNFDDPFADLPPAKKLRLTSSPKAVRAGGYTRSFSNLEKSTNAGGSKTTAPNVPSYKRSVSNIEGSSKLPERRMNTGGHQRSKTMGAVLKSDPIMFTSSPDPFADLRKRKERTKNTWEECVDDDDDIFDLRPSKTAGRRGVISAENFTLDDSSDSELPDLGALPYMAKQRASTKGKSAITALERYRGGESCRGKG